MLGRGLGPREAASGGALLHLVSFYESIATCFPTDPPYVQSSRLWIPCYSPSQMSPVLEKGNAEELEAGIKQVPAHGISIDIPSEGDSARPPNLRHMYADLAGDD